MKKLLLLMIIVAATGITMAAESDGQLHGTIRADYNSRFIWRGYDAYGSNHSAFQPSVDIDLFGTGFGVNVWSSRANGGGFENSEWMTYSIYYGHLVYADKPYALAYKVGYTYFSYPDEPSEGAAATNGANGHFQEVFAGFAMPKITGIKGLVPSYATFVCWASDSNAHNRNNGGWAHVFALNYDMQIPSICGNNVAQDLHLGAHIVYNDGVGPAGKNADHDWSHAVFTAALDFPINENLKFTPGINYQSSWDDSINTSDECWTSLTLAYKF